MKRMCGLLVMSVLVVSGCSQAEEAPATPPAPQPTAHGNLAQLMQAIPFPASNTVFDTQVNDPGTPPEATDSSAAATALYSSVYGGWTAVENAGVALQETANLILIPGRMCSNGQPVPVDQEDFRQWTANLASVGAEVTKFAQGKTYNEDAILDITGKVSDACAMCHEKYRDTPNQPADRCMVN